ncbi:MAG: hypothetical protein CL840_06410 [Crocinitomicaceae bacterium]|nr:hypothetical protein [Crocinitomicaceae bacterium]|tara:strand:+ start:6179 stop:7249 length:1071 start_codon:yes stop_codon:yes gene_type:complete
MRKEILLILFVLMVSLTGIAQRELQTAQYMLHPTFLNPAAVVTKSGKSGAFVFQNQWTGYKGAPTTMMLNFNAPLKVQDNTLGGIVISDKIGIHSRYKIMALYAHKFRIDRKSFFSLAVTPGFDLFQSDYSQALTDYPNDPIVSTSNQSLFSFNTGFGAYYYNNKIWAGFSIPELFYNRFIGSGSGTAFNLSMKEMNYQVVAGWKKDLNQLFTVKPSVLVKYQPGSPLQFDINALFEYKEEIGLGVTYRSLNSLNFMANYKINRDFKLGYAFNMQLGSELNNYHSGTHEVMLVYGVGNNRRANVNLPKKIKSYRKKKLKEVKKALKKTEKAAKEREKKEKQKKEQELKDENDQPYS